MKGIKGSLTVEASMLMSIIIPVLMSIIYLGFYLHNDAILKSAAYETAVYASLFQDDEEKMKQIGEEQQKRVKQRLIGAKHFSSQIQAGKKQVSVSYEGQMMIPGFVMRILADNCLNISGSVKMPLQDPGAVIVRVNSLKKLIKGAK